MWVSLGRRCEVTWQIRHHVCQQNTYPFDWLITPLQAVPTIIDDNFQDIAEPKFLEVVPAFHPYKTEFRGQTVLNTKYGVCLHHEFERTQDGYRIKDGWQEHVEEVKNKFQHLIQTWTDLMESGAPIDLIRQGGRMRLPREDELPTQATDLVKVLDAVQRAAKGPVSLTAVDVTLEDEEHRAVFNERNIKLVSVGRPTMMDWSSVDQFWQGSIERWTPVFSAGEHKS